MDIIKQQTSKVKIEACPNCKQNSLMVSNMPVTIHKQCIRCGYSIYKDYAGLDENDKAIIVKMDARKPIGCATLKYHNTIGESIISIPEYEMYEAFLIYLKDNEDNIEYCKLSSFKDNEFSETNLMLLL